MSALQACTQQLVQMGEQVAQVMPVTDAGEARGLYCAGACYSSLDALMRLCSCLAPTYQHLPVYSCVSKGVPVA